MKVKYCRWCESGEHHYRHSVEEDIWFAQTEVLIHRILAGHAPRETCSDCPGLHPADPLREQIPWLAAVAFHRNTSQ